MSLRVPCESCGGCGLRPLTVHQTAIVRAVGYDWSPSVEIAARLTGVTKVRPTLCNNLTALFRAGVLQRRALVGRSYEWRVNSEIKQAA